MRQKFILWLAKLIAPQIIKYRGNLYHYRKAIRKAEKAASGYGGKRHYIYFLGGKYRVLNRKQVQYWRNKTKGVRADLSVSRITGIQLYDTLGSINSHPQWYNVTVPGVCITYISAYHLLNKKSDVHQHN